MKYLKYFVLIAVVIFIQLGVLSNISLIYEISILPLVAFCLCLFAPIDICLILSFTMGFIYDISTMQRLPFLSLFLILEVIAISLIKKHFVNVSTVLGRIISVFSIIVLYEGFKALIFYRALSLQLVWVIIINFVLGVILVELIYHYRKYIST